MSEVRRAVLAAAFTCLSVGAALAQNLTLAVGAQVTSIDPHYHNYTPNLSLDAHIFEPLVDMDATSRPIPCLAESWRMVDDRTWEFKLRPAKFHNGDEFTAEDVAFTLARVPKVANSPSSFAIFTKSITGVQIVDPHTIRLSTKEIYPLLPIDLTQIGIIDHSIGDNPATEDFNSGKDAIGTGPFRFVSYRPGDSVELARNEDYWGKKPVWQRVTYRMISNDAARTAALLSGDVQFIDAVPTSDIARLRTSSALMLAEATSLRLIYLALDQSRDGPTPYVTGPDGAKLEKNPLKDRRVREALSIAINRPGIVSQVMEDAAVPSGQFLPPGTFSYVPELGPPAYAPSRAKGLLAEAGYPNGFRITLHGPNDRYLNDAKIVQAIGQMWTRAGVQTSVETSPWTNFVSHANKQDYSAFLLGWGSTTGEASSTLRALVATWDPAKGFGTTNRGRYSNPKVDSLIDQALRTADDAKREKVLQEATTLVFEDVAIIPLHIQKNTWAMRDGLNYVARADEQTRAADIHPKQ